MIWNIIVWIIVGAIGGWLASMIMGRNAQMGAVANIVVGIIGAFIGGFVLSALGVGGDLGSFNVTSILTSLVGAIILLAIVNLLTRGRIR